MYKSYKYALITLIWCVSAVSFASSNIQKTTNNFNFKNLSAQQKYSALDYGIYEPAKAIEVCTKSPNKMPAGGIWPADQSNPFPPPEPNLSDCEMSTQMAYGCTNYNSDTGRVLTRSVVGIMVTNPKNDDLWRLECTGIIIGDQWVLTNATCPLEVGRYRGNQYLVVPWQALVSGNFGVPTELDKNTLSPYATFKVREFYTPEKYHDIGMRLYRNDLALLKIDTIKPMGLEPIPVVKESLLSKPETPVITGGYGAKEDQRVDGQLRYRTSYYMKNIDSNGDYNGNIYMLDSKPVEYKGELSAWSFMGKGDAGGPVLSYNTLNHKLQLEGVNSMGLKCDYAGFFAKLPYPYFVAASTTDPYNNNFIKLVMKGKPTYAGEVDLSPFKNLYVINQIDNNITNYELVNGDNQQQVQKISTEYVPTQIAFDNVKHAAFVTNFTSNSISAYKVDSKGVLTKYQQIPIEPDNNGPIDIVYLSANYIFVLAKNSNSILQYENSYIASLNFKQAYPTLMRPTHLNIIWIGESEYLAVTNEREVAVYKWDKGSQKLVNTAARLALTSDMGKLIEIKSLGGRNNQKLYVLTTKGVYMYRLTEIDEGVVAFTLIGKLLNNFSPDSHIVPLYVNSFAISDIDSRHVTLYKVAEHNTIALKNTISIDAPDGMAFDNGTLYIINQPKLLSYTISYPDLTVSATPKIVETGLGPSILKINDLSRDWYK